MTVNRKTSNTTLLVYRMYKIEASTGLILIGILVLSSSIFKQLNQAKYRNLVINIGNGVKTKAQLTYPAGKGPFLGVLLSGANDMNENGKKMLNHFGR